jgi:hypothetical protein
MFLPAHGYNKFNNVKAVLKWEKIIRSLGYTYLFANES